MDRVQPINDLLTISEACKMLQCHPNTLRYWDKVGILKAIRFGKRGDRRYRKEDILALTNNQTQELETSKSNEVDFFKTELSQSLERMGHFQFITNELSKVVTSQQVADVIIRQTTLAFNAQSGFIALLHNDNEMLKIIHSVGFKKRALRPWDDLPLTAPIHLTDAVKTGNSVFIESIDEGKIRYPLTTKLAQASNDKSFAAAPLKVENRILGVLCISFSEVQKFTEADRLFLQAITNQCAQSFERATLYDKEQKARLQAEESAESFRNSEERLRLATEASDIYWWEFDFKTNSTRYSPNTEQIIGATPGKTLQENQLLLHPDDRDIAVQAFKEAIKNGTNFNYVVRSIAVSSEIRWFQVSGKIIRDNQNIPVLAIGISQNITQRTRHEANLTFLAQMSAQLELASSIEEIMQRVGSMLGEYLDLSRCVFSIVEQDADKITAMYEWKRETSLPSVLGSYQISDLLTKKGHAHYMSGKLAVIPDTKHNIFLAVPPELLYKSGNVALVDAPFIQDKKWKFLLTIARSKPTEWRSDETELIQELAARIYTRLERAHTEEALQLGKAQLQVLLDKTPMGVYLIDADFRIQAVNPTAKPIFGEIPDLIGRDFTKVIHGLWSNEYADEIVQLFRHTLKTGETYHTPERAEERRDLGVTQYYEWWVNRIPLPDGRDGVVCYFRDVSLQVSARLAIAESEEKYRTLFESIDEGFCLIKILFDKSGEAYDYVFIEANTAFERQSGLINVAGRSILELVPGLEPQWAKVYGQVAITGEPIRFEANVSSMTRFFDIYAFNGGENKVAVIFKDITERKRHEANLTFIVEVSQNLAGLTNISETMNALGAKIGKHFKASRCAFFEFNEALDGAECEYDWHQADEPSLVGSYRTSDFYTEEFRQTMRAGKVFVVSDRDADPRVNAENLAALNIASYIVIPISSDNQLRFALTIYDSKPRNWHDEEIELMREIVSRIWTRLERARADEELELRMLQQEVIANLGQKALTDISLEELMNEATNVVAHTLNTHLSKVMKLLPSENKLLYAAGVGWEKGVLGIAKISADKNALGGYALHHKKPVIFEDSQKEKRFTIPQILLDYKVVSGIHVIIQGRERPYGLLGACAIQKRQFNKHDINFVQAIANILAQFVERQEVQQGLQESEERYRSIVEGVKDYAIFTFDKSGTITTWNLGAQRLLGYNEKEAIGQNFSLIFTKEDIHDNKPQNELQSATEKGNIENENLSVRRDRSQFWASGVTTAIKNGRGELLGFVKIIRDVSQAKQTEKEKDRFVSLVSHELKNPMTSVMAFTQLLQKQLNKEKDSTSLKYLSHIDVQTRKIVNLITNLLEQSKERAKGFTFIDTTFAVDDLVQEVVEDMQRSKATHKIIVIGKAKKIICVDRARIGQVLENLLSNAIKYSPDANKVNVTILATNDTLTFSIQDFGMGISQEAMKNVFTPFFRASETQRESFPSIGLGLYISSEIIKHYNGRLWIKSEKGKGSTFFFSLPYRTQIKPEL